MSNINEIRNASIQTPSGGTRGAADTGAAAAPDHQGKIRAGGPDAIRFKAGTALERFFS